MKNTTIVSLCVFFAIFFLCRPGITVAASTEDKTSTKSLPAEEVKPRKNRAKAPPPSSRAGEKSIKKKKGRGRKLPATRGRAKDIESFRAEHLDDSFLETCNRYSYDDYFDQLIALCETPDSTPRHQRYAFSILRYVEGCTSDISNWDGHLVCERSRGNIPPGSYANSCTNIFVDGSLLWANCKSTDGKYKFPTSVEWEICTGDIYNDNGSLDCYTHQAGVPPGSYLDSCRFARLEGQDLHAECRTRTGESRVTYLSDYLQCSADPFNDDGYLTCPTNLTWDGSFRQTCREIAFWKREGSFRLTAYCRKMNGRWSETTLESVETCLGGINNNDGNLQCSR